MSNEFKIDKEWADRYYPAITHAIQIASSKIIKIEIAPIQEDIENAIDYLVTVETGKIACRVRRPNCGFRDFTIRAWRASGAKTELEKLREGFVKFYLYAWAKDDKSFSNWMLLDISKLQESGLLNRHREITINKDGTTGFTHIGIPELLLWNIIIYRGGEIA